MPAGHLSCVMCLRSLKNQVVQYPFLRFNGRRRAPPSRFLSCPLHPRRVMANNDVDKSRSLPTVTDRHIGMGWVDIVCICVCYMPAKIISGMINQPYPSTRGLISQSNDDPCGLCRSIRCQRSLTPTSGSLYLKGVNDVAIEK